MAYDGKVLRQATLRFDEDKQRRQEQQRQRQQQVYQQCPELESIQREIRGTMGEIIASALRRGTDPLPAIRVIRDKNLSLQKRRAELLAAKSYFMSFSPFMLQSFPDKTKAPDRCCGQGRSNSLYHPASVMRFSPLTLRRL